MPEITFVARWDYFLSKSTKSKMDDWNNVHWGGFISYNYKNYSDIYNFPQKTNKLTTQSDDGEHFYDIARCTYTIPKHIGGDCVMMAENKFNGTKIIQVRILGKNPLNEDVKTEIELNNDNQYVDESRIQGF